MWYTSVSVRRWGEGRNADQRGELCGLGSPERQREPGGGLCACMRVCVCKERYFKELAHVIVGAGRSQICRAGNSDKISM